MKKSCSTRINMGKKVKPSRGKLEKLEMKASKAKVMKKDNPFERKFGREKHKVLNRKSKVS